MKMETQVAARYLTFLKQIPCFHHLPPQSYMLPFKFDPLSHMSLSLRSNTSSTSQCIPILKSRQSLQICLVGGSGMVENNNEDSPWKAMEQFKGSSIEEALRQHIQKLKYDNGSGGVKPPRGGGSGGSGDGGFAGKSNETLQVILATIGFLFLYIYVITGEELTKLAKDYINYLHSGRRSVRLKRAMFKWQRLCQSLTEKVVDRHWLENAMLKRNHLQPKSNH